MEISLREMHNDFIELYVGNIFFIYFKAPRTVEPQIIDIIHCT